jgi:hypothetical protein
MRLQVIRQFAARWLSLPARLPHHSNARCATGAVSHSAPSPVVIPSEVEESLEDRFFERAASCVTSRDVSTSLDMTKRKHGATDKRRNTERARSGSASG